MSTEVLFVCTGNTCRSPMASSYFNQLARDSGIDHLQAGSAGMTAYGGLPMNPNARKALEKAGIRPDRHESRMLSTALVEEADFILTMTRSQRRRLIKAYPQAAEKTQLLMSLTGSDRNVVDPMGHDVDEYVRCLETMKPAIDHLFNRVADAEST